MDILKRVFGPKKKRSIADEDSFERLQPMDMDAILGGRPTDIAANSFDISTNLTYSTTPRTDYTAGKSNT